MVTVSKTQQKQYIELASALLANKPLVEVVAQLLLGIENVKNLAKEAMVKANEQNPSSSGSNIDTSELESLTQEAFERADQANQIASRAYNDVKQVKKALQGFTFQFQIPSTSADEDFQQPARPSSTKSYAKKIQLRESSPSTASEPTPERRTQKSRFQLDVEESVSPDLSEEILDPEVSEDEFAQEQEVEANPEETYGGGRLETTLSSYQLQTEPDLVDDLDNESDDLEDQEKVQPDSPPVPNFVGQPTGTAVAELLTTIANSDQRLLRFGLSIGDEVELFGNQSGILRFAGEVHFTSGNMFGIELTDGSLGKNNGDYDEIQYFAVGKPMKGIFIRSKQVRRLIPKYVESDYVRDQRLKEEARQAKIQAAIDKKIRQKGGKKKKSKKDMKKEENRVARSGVDIGEDVQIDMGRKGMVVYMGVIEDLHAEFLQYGIALTHGSIGDTDGRVGDVQYFQVEENRGCFVTADKIRKRIVMTVEEKYKRRLEDIYEQYDPSKLPKLKKVLRDSESLHLTYLKVCKKFKIEPQPEYRGR